ncbi:MAG: hypothetical protein DMF90_07755 [Acidobacteria bacterium]|nr:MAG: hypothetical protein DMF90_07755 [Acidobacteriota bacterium]
MAPRGRLTGSSVRDRQLAANHDNNNGLNNAEPIGLALSKFLAPKPYPSVLGCDGRRRRRTDLT